MGFYKVINLPKKHTMIQLLKALSIGALGGGIAHAINLPLAWMIGPMIANICASMAGVDVAISLKLRSSTLIILGCFLGSTFSPDLMDEILKLPVSIILVLLFVAFSTVVSALYFNKIAKFDFITSIFSATPGGLTPMTILGGSLGGKEQFIAYTHGIRVVAIVCLTPLLVFGILDGGQVENITEISMAEIDWLESFFLIGAAILGVFIASKLKIPAAQMTGAMFVSAGLYLSGTIGAPLPSILLEVTLWILGSAIGSRFSGFGMPLIKRLSVHAFLNVVCVTSLTMLVAWGLSETLGVSFLAILLAFSPGGVAEMCLIALALNIDPGFVALHHLARISMILLVTPLLASRLKKKVQS